MMISSKRKQQRKEGDEILQKLNSNRNKRLIIHYSGESFDNAHGRQPRITAICVKNCSSNETKSFAIHIEASKLNLKSNFLSEMDYEVCEKNLLSNFFEYMKSKRGYLLLHWNMQDASFGFEALFLRYQILKNTVKEKTIQIENENKIDFSTVLELLYTSEYECKRDKKSMLNLAFRNNLITENALEDKEESEEFDKGNYLAMHNSTLRKVNILSSFLTLTESGELKVKASVLKIHGLNLDGLSQFVHDNKLLSFCIVLFSSIFWAAVEPKIQHFFGTDKEIEIKSDSLKIMNAKDSLVYR